MNNLWSDIQAALVNSLEIVNFATEPVSASEISEISMGTSFRNETEKNPVFYNMLSRYAHLFTSEPNKGYMASKKDILSDISEFIRQERG